MTVPANRRVTTSKQTSVTWMARRWAKKSTGMVSGSVQPSRSRGLTLSPSEMPSPRATRRQQRATTPTEPRRGRRWARSTEAVDVHASRQVGLDRWLSRSMRDEERTATEPAAVPPLGPVPGPPSLRTRRLNLACQSPARTCSSRHEPPRAPYRGWVVATIRGLRLGSFGGNGDGAMRASARPSRRRSRRSPDRRAPPRASR